MAQDEYCLRWNNFQTNVFTSFTDALRDENYVDVTLTARTCGRSFKAHRVLLSASSDYFDTIFRDVPPFHHPVVIIECEYQELRSLMSFIYEGQVTVQTERLKYLFRLANNLRIKGLQSQGGDDEDEEDEDQPNERPTCRRKRKFYETNPNDAKHCRYNTSIDATNIQNGDTQLNSSLAQFVLNSNLDLPCQLKTPLKKRKQSISPYTGPSPVDSPHKSRSPLDNCSPRSNQSNSIATTRDSEQAYGTISPPSVFNRSINEDKAVNLSLSASSSSISECNAGPKLEREDMNLDTEHEDKMDNQASHPSNDRDICTPQSFSVQAAAQMLPLLTHLSAQREYANPLEAMAGPSGLQVSPNWRKKPYDNESAIVPSVNSGAAMQPLQFAQPQQVRQEQEPEPSSNTHQYMHWPSRRPATCPYCQKYFKFKYNMKIHFKKCHKNVDLETTELEGKEKLTNNSCQNESRRGGAPRRGGRRASRGRRPTRENSPNMPRNFESLSNNGLTITPSNAEMQRHSPERLSVSNNLFGPPDVAQHPNHHFSTISDTANRSDHLSTIGNLSRISNGGLPYNNHLSIEDHIKHMNYADVAASNSSLSPYGAETDRHSPEPQVEDLSMNSRGLTSPAARKWYPGRSNNAG